MRMRKGKPVTSAILLTAALLLTGVSGCAEKPVETSMSTVHTTWQETTETTTETTTEPATETTADPVLLREPFVGKWVGLLKANRIAGVFRENAEIPVCGTRYGQKDDQGHFRKRIRIHDKFLQR